MILMMFSCALVVVIILIQKSEGGALGIGNSQESFVSSRSAGNFLTKTTAVIATLFIVTSIMLTIFSKEEISINLPEQKIIFGNKEINFDIDQFKKKCLLEGLDDISLSLEKLDKIINFEKKIKSTKPWIFSD